MVVKLKASSKPELQFNKLMTELRTMKLRPLGITKDILESIGLNITHTYDDLVFVENNPFLIQFDDENPSYLKIFFHADCTDEAVSEIEKLLIDAASKRDFSIAISGRFDMEQKEGTEEIELKFLT
ncbi:hypothetical protein [Maridesulfovibrio sp.]|uniref:hypothetical protein n=1 Tax=Maridesulfovibrio sp. TaxID=2795000 RepID=UPI002AA709C9|nr:hypothetical protein [Maridesulfovibrio sp.]